jgi:hypothetical protein
LVPRQSTPGDRTGIRTDRAPAAQTVARVGNRARLTDHGDHELRATVLDLAEVALAALSPSAGLRRTVRLDGENLAAGGRSYDLAAVDRLVVLGAGKATAQVAMALEGLLGPRLDGGVVVVPHATATSMRRLTVLPGEHPVPGPASVTGARALLDQAARLGQRDLAICVFTGGSSALASVPRRVFHLPASGWAGRWRGRPPRPGACWPPWPGSPGLRVSRGRAVRS